MCWGFQYFWNVKDYWHPTLHCKFPLDEEIADLRKLLIDFFPLSSPIKVYRGGLAGLESHNLTVITTKIYALLFVRVEEPCRRAGRERSTWPIRSKRSYSCKRGNLPNTWLTPWEAESHSFCVQRRMGRNRMLPLCHCEVLDKKIEQQPVLNKNETQLG